MAYTMIGGFPPQQLSFKKKNWKELCVNSGLNIEENPDLHRQYNEHIFLVYMHVNKVNGKVYVGLTHHVNPNKRWGYSGQKYYHCTKFTRAIKKYGWDNFEHIILCRTSKERAIIIEKSLISYYKKLGISYNLSDGGEGTEAITEQNRKALRERLRKNPPMKGKHHTPEVRALISKAVRQRRVYTEAQKEQLRRVSEKGRETMRKRGYWIPEESVKRIAEQLSKSVVQLDIDGNYIREFSSTRDADRFINNGKCHNHISDVCKGKRKTEGGYKWMYKDEWLSKQERRAV